MPPKEKYAPTTSVRLPTKLLLWLKKRCSSSCRSMSAEVVYLLTKAKEETESKI